MPLLPARYDQARALGPDPLGERYAAWDLERGRTVELVRAAARPGEDPRAARAALERAYWALATCPHRALLPVLDQGLGPDGTPYFTREAPPGPSLADERLPLAEADVRAWLPDVVSALAALHERGHVHGQLAPACLYRQADGGVLLALSAPVPAGVAGPPRGDPTYASPEVASRAPLDARADWYGLAAVLFHLLSGQPPYASADTAALLTAHREAAVPRLRQVLPAASRQFDEALLRLLAKDPAARPTEPAGVLAAFGLAGEVRDRVQLLLASPVLGRGREFAAIARLLEQPGPAGLCMLGPAEVGKSRLIEEARARARFKSIETFQARGLGLDAPPYEALLPWLRALVARAPSGASEAVAAVCGILPELGGPPRPAPTSALEAAQARAALQGAVIDLARTAAPAGLWLLDDADRLDAASAALLAAMRRAGGRWRWLLACEAAPQTAPGQAPDEHITVAPLAADDVVALARRHLGHIDLPAAMVATLPALSAGLPGRVAELLRHWIAQDDLVRDAGRWVAAPGASWEPPPDYEIAMDQALAAMGPATRAIARTAALLGERCQQSWLQAAVGLAPERFFATVKTLESADMLVRDGAHMRFTRPGQAVAIMAAIPPAERRHLRAEAAGRIARALSPALDDSSLPLADALALAHLQLESDEPARGVPWAIAAARRALAIHAPAQAEALALTARALPDLAPTDRLALGLQLADAWRNLGRAADAFTLYEAELMPALRAAPPADMAHHVVTYGVLQQAKGAYPAARALWTEAIALADAAGQHKEGVRARIFAGRLAFFEGRGAEALELFGRAVAEARTAHLEPELGWALALYGHMLGTLDPARLAEGLACLAEARSIHGCCGNQVRLFEALNDEGNLLLAAGRPYEARELFERCESIGAAVGPQEAIYAHLNLAFARLDLGEPAAARVGAALSTELAQRLGARLPESFAAAVEGLALVRVGSPALGWVRIERALGLAGELGNRYAELAAGALAVEVLVELGRWEAARAALARIRDLAKATANHEHDARLDRLATALEVLGRTPTAAAAADALVTSARTRGSQAELAQALRWQAQQRVLAGELEAAAGPIVAAEEAAAKAHLLLIRAELHLLQGERVLARGQALEASYAFDCAMSLAREQGAVPLELAAMAGLAQADPARAALAEEARTRFRILAASLAPAERDAYARVPGLQRLATGLTHA